MRKQNIVNRPFALDAVEDYRTKVTLGITGWYCLRVHIDGSVRHLDVGSPYPGAGEGPKGLAVRQLKRYASWVQTVCWLINFDPQTNLNPTRKLSYEIPNQTYIVFSLNNRKTNQNTAVLFLNKLKEY
jgi:hypothetical protein